MGHGYSPAPLFPLETLWICTLAGNPTGLCSFLYLCFILFLFLHIFFCLSLCHTFLVASHYRFLLCLASSSASVRRDDFLLDTNSNFLYCQPLVTETFHTAPCLFLLYCVRAQTAAVTPFPFLSPLTLLSSVLPWFRVDPMPHDTPKPPGYTRFVCISDTHSRTDSIQMPYGDVFIHAGDFTELGLPSEVKKFNDWLGQHH